MSNAVYPLQVRGLDYRSTKEPRFSTIVQPSPAEYEVRVAQMQNPIWKFTLTYTYLKNLSGDIPVGLTYTDLQFLMGFFLARYGQQDSFLYPDPSDQSVGPALLVGGAPNLQAQLQVVGPDASGIYYSPVQILRGGQFYEDITDLNGGISVYDNGTIQVGGGVNYTLNTGPLAIPGFSSSGLYLQWTAQPTGPVTAQFLFYFRVRFDTDERAFDQFLNSFYWCLGGDYASNSNSLTFRTARPVS